MHDDIINFTERMEAVIQGVKQAKQDRAKAERKIAEKAKSQTTTKHDTSSEYLARFFRAASPRSVEMGKARLILEDAVKQAERILLEKKRAQMASATSVEDQAEMLAQEIFHIPGSLLTKEEFAHIYSEIPDCFDPRGDIDCMTIPFVDSIRTADGTCNNKDKPTRGSSFTAYRRLLPAHYEDGLQQLHGYRQSKLEDSLFRDGPYTPPYPSARLISSTIVRDRKIDNANLTHLIMQWGQFTDHDLDLNVEVSPEEAQCDAINCTFSELCAPIQVSNDDTAFGEQHPRKGACLPFARTLPACSAEKFEARNPVNELTHYMDASMIYGSTKEVARFLREFQGGRLRVGDVFPGSTGKPSLPEVPASSPCLPFDPKRSTLPSPERCCPEGRESCFTAGDRRVNEQLSLTVMHTIWVREHNRIAAELARFNPQWDDERIYQESRKIVIAQVQQITFKEFLPAILGPDFFDTLIGPYSGYIPERDSSIPNSFATAAFRFGHSLIQDAFDRIGPDYLPNARGPLNLRDAFMNPQAYFDSQGTDPIIRGWITQPARAVDEFLNSVLTTQLFEREEGLGMDLATLNIQRSRDHGLPPYPAWKQFCQNRFGDVLPEELFQFSNELTKIRFLQTYGALDTVDLWVGGLAEEPIPGGVVGPTFACIFAIAFSNLRSGDRFWYESNNTFTSEQLAEIERTSLAKILCDNGDAISMVQPNTFFLGRRQSCSSIAGIDFAPWSEDPLCYQRVRIEPHIQDINFFYLSILPQNHVRYYPLKRSGQSASQFEICIPFECPTSSNNIRIANFPSLIPNGTNYQVCRATANPSLPSSLAPPGAGSVYEAVWSTQTVQLTNGLHRDLDSCQRSTVVALTFDCPLPNGQSAVKSNAELESELERILQTGGSGADKNSGTNTTLTFLPLLDLTRNADAIPQVVHDFISNPVS